MSDNFYFFLALLSFFEAEVAQAMMGTIVFLILGKSPALEKYGNCQIWGTGVLMASAFSAEPLSVLGSPRQCSNNYINATHIPSSVFSFVDTSQFTHLMSNWLTIKPGRNTPKSTRSGLRHARTPSGTVSVISMVLSQL